jgi:hypothetical protein
MKSKTDINGPLEFYVNEFYFELLFFGYTELYCRNLLFVFKDLNQWLHKKNFPLSAFNEVEVNRFLATRVGKLSGFLTIGSISTILNFFWNRGLIPAWIPEKVIKTPLDSLIRRYEKYLTEERNLCSTYIWILKKVALDFLLKSCGKNACLRKLKVQTVRSYILQKKNPVINSL